MDDYQVQVSARLTALGHVLEVLLANEFAAQPEAANAHFKQEILSRAGYSQGGPLSSDLMQAIEAETNSVLARFVEKVSERAAEIRSEL
jgi:hypothetical protein